MMVKMIRRWWQRRKLRATLRIPEKELRILRMQNIRVPDGPPTSWMLNSRGSISNLRGITMNGSEPKEDEREVVKPTHVVHLLETKLEVPMDGIDDLEY